MNLERQENVGTLGAYIRVSGGLILLGLAAFGRFGRIASWAMFAAGASSVASGIARYCPVTEAIRGPSYGAGDGEALDDDGFFDDEEAPVARDLPWESEGSHRPGDRQEPGGWSGDASQGQAYESQASQSQTHRSQGSQPQAPHGQGFQSQGGPDQRGSGPETRGPGGSKFAMARRL